VRLLSTIVISAAALSCTLASFGEDEAAYQALTADTVLVTVNRQPITKGDLEFELLWRRVSEEQQPAFRARFVDELIDRQLLRAFLRQRRVEVPDALVDQQLEQLRQLVTAGDGNFDEIIRRLGFTEASLREHLQLPLAWRVYLNRAVTEGQLKDFFEERREQFDGTRVRASQIVIAVPKEAGEDEWRAAEQTLRDVRREIASGDLEFAEAARRYSTSPSRENGGDLGMFTFHGTVPAAVATAAFALDVNGLGQPIRSEFGVHLLMVTDRIAGQLSLEDVRARVLDQLSHQMWEGEAKRLREGADIKWRIEPAILDAAV
jgi:parvulin-like peptidyl-prolyl isomerase